MKLMMEWTEQYVQRAIVAELKNDIAGKMCDLEASTGELNECMASLILDACSDSVDRLNRWLVGR